MKKWRLAALTAMAAMALAACGAVIIRMRRHRA